MYETEKHLGKLVPLEYDFFNLPEESSGDINFIQDKLIVGRVKLFLLKRQYDIYWLIYKITAIKSHGKAVLLDLLELLSELQFIPVIIMISIQTDVSKNIAKDFDKAKRFYNSLGFEQQLDFTLLRLPRKKQENDKDNTV